MSAVALALASSATDARQDGITGRSGNPYTAQGATCRDCHGSVGDFDYRLPAIAGPNTVGTSTTNAYTLDLTRAGGAAAARAGFDLSATGGTLVDPDASDDSLKRVGAELTHGAPRLPDANGDFSWNFSWTAPGSPGRYVFYVCGDPVNFDGLNAGDGSMQCSATEIRVTAATNSAPVANHDRYTTPPDTALVRIDPAVVANDFDPDGDPIFATKLTDTADGTVTLNGDGSFTYQPNAGFTGLDSFTYRVSDGTADSATATVVIEVTATFNAVPSANYDGYVTAEGAMLEVPAPGIRANDRDREGGGPAMKVRDPSSGVVMLGDDGAFAYSPPAGFSGTDSFTYQLRDLQGNSNVATVFITVANGLTAPVAAGETYTTTRDTPLTIAAPGVLANDTDAEGDDLVALLRHGGNNNGSTELLPGGGFTFTPRPGFVGIEQFAYQANDGAADSNLATVTVTVTDPEPPPDGAYGGGGGGGGGGGYAGGGDYGGGGGPAPLTLALLALVAYLRGLKSAKRRAISP